MFFIFSRKVLLSYKPSFAVRSSILLLTSSYQASQDVSPSEERAESNVYISISSTFNPGAVNDARQTNLIILSSDAVFFYVDSSRLLEASENGFDCHLPFAIKADMSGMDSIMAVPERSSIVNLLLHAVYSIGCAQYAPSFEDLSETVATLTTYGMSIPTFLIPSSPLSDALLVYAPTRSLDLYALAASYGVHELAVTTSPHLLSLSLPSVTDEVAEKIGSFYLKKLFFLHLGRTDALKRLLQSPPHPHVPTATCRFEEQKGLTRAWALASAYIAWNAQPHTSSSTIEDSMRNLANHVTCELCKSSLQDRIRSLAIQWSLIKVSWHLGSSVYWKL